MKAKRQEKKDQLWCPYCDEEIMDSQLPYCQACKLTIFYCPECRRPVAREKKVCPHCGASLKLKAT